MLDNPHGLLSVTASPHLGQALVGMNAPEAGGPLASSPVPVVSHEADLIEHLRRIHVSLMVLHTDQLVLTQTVREIDVKPVVTVTVPVDHLNALIMVVTGLRMDLENRTLGARLRRLFARLRAWWG